MNSSAAFISIVMGTYNGEKYVAEQIESILRQSHGNFELIIVDDCSRDTTLEIVRKYQAADRRISVYPAEENLGVIANFERGLRHVKGEFVALSDQDDVWDPDKISVLLQELENNEQIDMVVSDMRLIDGNGAVIGPSMWRKGKIKPMTGKAFEKVLYSNFVTGCACMFRARLLARALPMPASCFVHDWWLAIVASSENCGGIAIIKKPLLSYRLHGSNVIGVTSRRFSAILSRIAEWEDREKKLNAELGRINGYLQRNGFWGPSDIRSLHKIKKLFEGFLKDADNNFIRRIMQLPIRLHFGLMHHVPHTIGVLFLTVFPVFWGRLAQALRRLTGVRKANA